MAIWISQFGFDRLKTIAIFFFEKPRLPPYEQVIANVAIFNNALNNTKQLLCQGQGFLRVTQNLKKNHPLRFVIYLVRDVFKFCGTLRIY